MYGMYGLYGVCGMYACTLSSRDGQLDGRTDGQQTPLQGKHLTATDAVGMRAPASASPCRTGGAGHGCPGALSSSWLA